MLSPYALLKDIATRSHNNAAQLPQQIEAVRYWRGVGFMLAGHSLVIDMNQISEILQPPRLTKIPGVRSWVLGVANVRGRLVPIMDLAGLLGLPSKANWRSRRVLIFGQGENLNGLLVDAVLGMQQFSQDSLAASTDLAAELQKFCPQGFEKDGRQWPVFELNELVTAAEFLQVAV